MALAAGQRVGDYEILDVLGTGGMGRVYRVRNVISDRVEAMKILLPDYASDAELAQRFMAEIRTLATLEHPNIAQLRTAFQFENQLVMVMEFVEGATLEHMAGQSRLPVDQVLEYAMQVLSALSYAHSRNVIHRDIKPSNIMITSHGLAKIMDFGIAKSASDLQLTRPGTTMGSVYYMSPEQVRGGTVDARSDLYSCGVTLYEMFTGRRPFQSDTSFTVLNAQLNEQPQPPIEINPALPPALNSIILCAMAKDPADRFQSADAFRNALKFCKDAQPEVPATASQVQPPSQPLQGVVPVMVSGTPAKSSSHRGLWVAAGAITALVALAAAALLLPRVFATHANQSSATQTAADAAPQSAPPASAATPSVNPQEASAAPSGSQPGTSPTPATQPSASPAMPDTAPVAAKPPAPIHRGSGSPPVSAQNPPADQTTPSGGAQPSPPPGPSPAEIRASRDRLSDLDARADSTRSGIQAIRSQQQAQGFDLRGDIVSALNRLNNDLSEASNAISQNDLTSAEQYMDRADRELATLEKFLGR